MNWEYSTKTKLLKIFLVIFSRPSFFNFFYGINKICLNAMNRTAASQLSPNFTGEKKAFKFAFEKLKNHDKLVIFDGGGSYGDYSNMIKEICYSANNNFDLYIFEPSSVCFSYLSEKNKNLENIKLYKLALSEENSCCRLYSPWEGSSGASLAELKYLKMVIKNSSDSLPSETVNTTKLDDFCDDNNINKIDFLKLDIEGFELSALKGAYQMIMNGKIKFIQIEIGSASLTTKSMLFDFWEMFNNLYYFYLILNQGLIEIKEYKADLESFYGASNFLLQLKK
ncbi:FkbM family methyltransferase [Anabaena lutea]|uniref:FkbM family methyltransferase n=1 Tax=Anabaena lutea FACHB-196 TaxID=2692881 RepID=A0ABR8FFK5_9NOST|nr:FkbM family methyltransferase [Anabaena lutea]MBD2568819.1 FkbM family methyltransferase [Anabaena lutea FACHB-196]